MSVIDYAKGKLNDFYELIKWEMKWSTPFHWPFYVWHSFMNRERGLDFPFYFNNEKKFVERKLAIFIEWMNNFVNLHEPERWEGETDHTLIKRVKYVAKNFPYYMNDTMSNLYYSSKLPQRDYARLKTTFLHYYMLFFIYNSASGIFLVALNNYFFRTRKASIPVALVASITTFVLFSGNYKVSYKIMDSAFNQSVRRMGHQHLIQSYGSYYPRNVDFLL